MKRQSARVSPEARKLQRLTAVLRLFGVGFGEPVEGGLVGYVEVDTVLQDGLHGAVLGVVEGERASAGRFEAHGAEAPGEPDDALCGAQVVEDTVSEQPLDEGVTGRTDVFALTQTPLGVAQLVGDRLGGQVLVDGAAAARSELSKMGGGSKIRERDHSPTARGSDAALNP